MCTVYSSKTTFSDFKPSDTTSELCRKFRPPPIPPWLQDTSINLHHRVTKCAKWKQYSELCSLQVPSDYPQAVTDLQADTALTQWIPLITTLLMVAMIVLCVGVTYFLYRSKRWKLDFLDKYSKYVVNSNQSSREPGCMIPSISTVTQLSVYALEDDCFRSLTPAQAYIDDLVPERTNTMMSGLRLSYTSPQQQNSEEILLLPEQLMEHDIQSPCYVSNLSGTDYHSSHSLPIDSDCEKLLTSNKQQPVTVFSCFGTDENVRDICSYIQLQTDNPQHKYYSCLDTQQKKYCDNVGYRKMAGVKGMVERCQKAGASLIHGATFWNRNSGYVPTKHTKTAPTFVQLRQSVYKMCTSRTRFPTTSKRLQPFQLSTNTSHITDSDSAANACSSICVESGALMTHVDTDICSSTSHRTKNRLKHVGHLLRYGRNEKSAGKPETVNNQTKHIQAPTITYANDAYDSQHGTDIKLTRPTFRELRMPNVLRKINKRIANSRFLHHQ